MESLSDTEQVDDVEGLSDTEQVDDVEGLSDTEQVDDVEGLSDTEQVDDVEGLSDTEQVDDVEGLSDTEQVDDVEGLSDTADTEQVDDVEGLSDTEQVDDVEGLSDTEQVDDVEGLSDTEQVDGVEDLSADDTDMSSEISESEIDNNDACDGSAFNESELDPRFLEPLFAGANINVLMTYCIIMQYAYKYKLSYKALQGLIHLLLAICPTPNALPTSLYKLKKFFKQFSAGFKDQKICSTCSVPYADKCSTCAAESLHPGHVIHMHVVKSLQSVVSRKLQISLQLVSMQCTLCVINRLHGDSCIIVALVTDVFINKH